MFINFNIIDRLFLLQFYIAMLILFILLLKALGCCTHFSLLKLFWFDFLNSFEISTLGEAQRGRRFLSDYCLNTGVF